MKHIWTVLFSISGVFCLYFVCTTSLQIKNYLALNTQTDAHIVKWTVTPKGPSEFSIQASYHFSLKDQEFMGKTEFIKPYFLNELAANLAVKKLSTESWTVFFYSSDPNKNSLQRFFPFRSCIHTFLTLGIFLYFIFLKKWLERSFV